MFETIQVDSRVAESLEPLGTKRKFWFTDSAGCRVLFKAEERGTGEDWAEKVSSEFCRLLGLPHVHYELAFDSGSKNPGVVCETCAPQGRSLVLGNQLLSKLDPDYPAEEECRYKVREHTLRVVVEAVGELQYPPQPWADGIPAGIESALDVFVGYVMLDAWIANQDRHHENWGALQIGKNIHLAPTFDHGASMARNLSDAERDERMTTKDAGRSIGRFVQRARSAFYRNAGERKPMTTMEAWQAFSLEAENASATWTDRLQKIEDETIRNLLEEVPPDRMSRTTRDFTYELLMENRRRILAGED